MADLRIKYLGLELKNPIIVGACNLVTDINSLKKIEEAGAAAVVYKSLFEEQIQIERFRYEEDLEAYNERNAEMTRIFPNIEHAGPEEHLNELRKAKDAVKIPVIASLNAVYTESWVEYAMKIQETGVDAIELNFYNVPREFSKESYFIERQQLDIVKEVIAELKIPVSVKLSANYANALNLIDRMDREGIKGVVLFNRFFQPSIDIDKIQHSGKINFSSQSEKGLALRFAGLLFSEIKASICANTGIHTSSDVIEMLLAGADAVQVVSTLYLNKIEYIQTIIAELNKWMDEHKFSSIEQFKGKLSRAEISDDFVYKRAQYIDIILNSKNIFGK